MVLGQAIKRHSIIFAKGAKKIPFRIEKKKARLKTKTEVEYRA